MVAVVVVVVNFHIAVVRQTAKMVAQSFTALTSKLLLAQNIFYKKFIFSKKI